MSEEETPGHQVGQAGHGASRSAPSRTRPGAMLEDLAIGYRRVAYAISHGTGRSLREAMLVAQGIVKLGDHIAAHLDDSALPRVTTFVGSGAVASREVPPDQGQRILTPGEDPYVDVREEDVP